MSVPIAVADVFTDVAFRLHLPAFGPTEFVSDTQALQLFKGSLGRLSGLLTRLYGDDLFAETITVQTQADVETVSLPDDFHTLRSVHWITNNRAIEMARVRAADYTELAASWDYSNPPKYALESYVLRLVPIPTAAYTLRIAYTTTLTVEDATDTIYGNVGWQEWLINDMCERIRMREQKSFDEFTRARLECEGEIREQATQRDRSASIQVRDVRGELDRDRRMLRYRRWE